MAADGKLKRTNIALPKLKEYTKLHIFKEQENCHRGTIAVFAKSVFKNKLLPV